MQVINNSVHIGSPQLHIYSLIILAFFGIKIFEEISIKKIRNYSSLRKIKLQNRLVNYNWLQIRISIYKYLYDGRFSTRGI